MTVLSTIPKHIPFHAPMIEEQDILAVVEVLRSGWITTGQKVQQFEQELAAYIGAAHTLVVSSGTAALHLALDAISLTEGDEVLVPTITFAATAEVVQYFKARPILMDCDPHTYNLDADHLEKAITSRTRAIIPVHFQGHPCEMDRILEVAAYHELKVIEDAAHALPARYKNRMVGTIGDITCFSFYATKTLTTGEGGMVGTENTEYADRMRLMSLHGISKDAWKRYSITGSWKYEILQPGYKYNMTDLQAALGLTQLGKCDSMWKLRALLAEKYTIALGSLDAFKLPHVAAHVQHAWHLYVVLVDNAVLRIHRDQVIEELRARGIGASVHFIPLHLHPYYQSRWGYRLGDFPVAEDYFDRCISLPIYPSMTSEDADRVIQGLHDIAARFRR